MTPPQMQFNVDVLFNAGALQSMTVGAPGIQGAGVIGMQGCGFSTPEGGIAVAAATAGFPGHVHIPKGGILAPGRWSMILAASTLLVITVLGVGTKLLGARPKLHFIVAPRQV